MKTLRKRAKAIKTEWARKMRKNLTKREAEVWELVRASKCGAPVRRQHVIAGFIVDFWCHKAALVVEIDGPSHAIRKQYDALRDYAMRCLGITVMRFPVETPAKEIAAIIKAVIRTRYTAPMRSA